MKKLLLFCVLLISFIQIFSQENLKKEFYYDEVWNLITKKNFKKSINYRYNLPKVIENDTAIIRKLISRQAYGIIKSEQKEQFIKLLEKITEKKIDLSKTIIINYFFEKNSCLDHYSSDKQYLKRIAEDKNIVQFFITAKNYNYSSKKTPVFQDKYDIVQRLFFKYEFQCGNYLIIKPTGKYYRYYGEYMQSKILDKVKSEWKYIP